MLGHSGYTLSAQDKTYHLFDEPRKFLMKPDIVIKNKMLGQVFVMDTKWKVLSDAKANYGISQADMYQMYAYQKVHIRECYLALSPYWRRSGRKISDSSRTMGLKSKSDLLICFDLSNSLKAIIQEIMETSNEGKHL